MANILLKVLADTSQAVGQMKRLDKDMMRMEANATKGAMGLGAAIDKIAVGFGKFNLAVGGVMLVVEAFKALEAAIYAADDAADKVARTEYDRVKKGAEATVDWQRGLKLLTNEYDLVAGEIAVAEDVSRRLAETFGDQYDIARDLVKAIGDDAPKAIKKYGIAVKENESVFEALRRQMTIVTGLGEIPSLATGRGRTRGGARAARKAAMPRAVGQVGEGFAPGFGLDVGALLGGAGFAEESPFAGPDYAAEPGAAGGDLFAGLAPPIDPTLAFAGALRDSAIQASVAADAYANLSGAFTDIGDAMAKGELTAAKFTKSLAAAGLKSLASYAEGKGKLYAAEAIGAFAAGNVPQGLLYTAGAAAMFTAAGCINAKASQLGAGGGGGGGGGGAGAGAGGGFARPSGGAQGGGGTVTNVFIGQGFVGDEKKLAEEFDKVQRKGQRSGHVRQGNSAVIFQ